MTKQDQLKRLREDLQACINYLNKPVTLPSMVKVRSEHNLRNLQNMLEDAEANGENLRAGYLRDIISNLDMSDSTGSQKQKTTIEHVIGSLDSFRKVAA